MASIGGLAAIAGAGASLTTVHSLFTEACCLQQKREVRRGAAAGGDLSNEGGFASSALLFCGERFGSAMALSSSSSSCQEKQRPLSWRAAPQPRAFYGGATTTTTKEEQYNSSSSSKEMRSSVRTPSTSTLYDVLGVSKSSSAKEIKAAYRQAARKLHPDVVPAEQRQDSTKSFLLIQNAYNVLSDDQSRAAYDLQLLSMQQQRRPKMPISMDDDSNWSFTASPPSAYSSTDFCSPFKGSRSWETDQCW